MVSGTDKNFSGAIPRLYETYLVPLIFAPYAADLAARVAARSPARVLEMAAGTGVATRAMSGALPDTTILATDLNQAMLDEAAARGAGAHVEWRQADALQLPVPDASVDVVACQFGVMFFPDKARAFAEARRVLRPGGALVFSVWDAIGRNEFADAVDTAVATVFPDDPPRFLSRTPYGYFDHAAIARDLAEGGFDGAPEIATLTARSRAQTARDPAIAFCHGTPLRSEIETRDPSGLDRATDAAARVVESRFGSGPVDGRIQAHVITVTR